VYDISAEVYHSDPVPGGSLSSTGARKLANECPAAFKYWLDHPQPAKGVRLRHRSPQGRPRRRARTRPRRARHLEHQRGQGGDQEDPGRREHPAQAARPRQGQRDGRRPARPPRSRRTPGAGSGIAERTIIWNDHGVWRRIRIDWLRHDGTIVDYKSCRSANPAKLPNHIFDYGYHQQQEYYRDGALEFGLTELVCPFKFIFQEKEPPYLVSVIELDSTACSIGKHLNDVALNTYALCREAGEWPGYLNTPLVSLPAWVERQYR
jgi:hypothetical protein